MRNKMQVFLLSTAILCAAVVMLFLGNRYFSASRELSGLKKDLAESTAAWKQTNEEKLVVQKELKEIKNEIREAELTISESEERTKTLEKDILDLEKEIEDLKSGLPADD